MKENSDRVAPTNAVAKSVGVGSNPGCAIMPIAGCATLLAIRALGSCGRPPVLGLGAVGLVALPIAYGAGVVLGRAPARVAR
jgi:hypothetical protein